MPELEQDCMKSWDYYLPDYKKVLWNENTFDVYSNPYTREAYLCKKYAFVSDYVRLYALYHDGGIYMDTDVEIIKNINGLLEYPAFSGFENPYYIQTALMGTVAGHPWVKRALDHYEGKTFLRDGAMDMMPNVVFMTELLEQEFGLKKGNEQQVLKDDIHIFPNDWFCPKVFYTKEILLTENSHAIHHFAASWF